MADLINRRLGNYEIRALLGSGGMATVYRAHQLNIKRDVAIKVINPALSRSPDFVKRFEREAEIIAALSHPHIVKLFDYAQDGNLLYLVMELYTGGSLAGRIRSGPLSLTEIARLLDQLGSALDYAHARGITHRDLKPQNVLLDDSGNAHLTDFGIVKLLNQTTALTASGAVMGTPAYMSPEQWQGGMITAQTDVYGLGVVLFEMLSGKLPFDGDTPYRMMYMHLHEMPLPASKLREGVPSRVDQVINRALAKDPSSRYESASRLAAAFRQATQVNADSGFETAPAISDETPVVMVSPNLQAAAPAKTPAQQRDSFRARLAAAIAILIVVGLLGGFALIFTHLPSDRPVSVQSTATITVETTMLSAAPVFTSDATQPPTNTKQVLQISAVTTISAGCFTMGSDKGDATAAPAHRVCLDSYRIDKYPVSWVNYGNCVSKGNCVTPRSPDYGKVALTNYPVVGLTWVEAQSYCIYLGGDLPTEAQWEYAARGDNQWDYPWGSAPPDQNQAVFGGLTTAQPVDSKPDGASPFGVVGMAGNVWHWVKDWYDPSYYASLKPNSLDPVGPLGGKLKVVRGGAYNSPPEDLKSTKRQLMQPDSQDATVGFRCAYSAR